MRRARAFTARGGFTLIEVITVITVSSFIVMSLVAMFKLCTRGVVMVVDRTDLEIQGRAALETIQARLVDSQLSSTDNRFRIREFRNIPGAWTQNGFRGAFHFFADVTGDGVVEWVWVWVDPVGTADQKGDVYPRPPFLKMTAFRRYPTRPDQWADYNDPFFSLVNNDPNCYYILASNLTLAGTYDIGGSNVTLDQGFGVDLQAGNNYLDIKLGMSIDRDLRGISQGEPVVHLDQRVNLENHGNPVPTFPDPQYLSNAFAVVRDSALPHPLNNPMGRMLLDR